MSLKKSAVKAIVIWIMIGTLNINVMGRYWANHGGSAYDEADGGSASTISNSIEDHIVRGARYYYKANSNVQRLLEIFEAQDVEGIDPDVVNGWLEGALENMSNAVETYGQLIGKAETTPYNSAFVAELMEIDYDDFAFKNGLNAVVIKELEGYLKQGDVTGVFKKIHARLLKLQNTLILIKIESGQNRIPGTSVFWKLNEKFSESSLFGSYAARVFKSVL